MPFPPRARAIIMDNEAEQDGPLDEAPPGEPEEASADQAFDALSDTLKLAAHSVNVGRYAVREVIGKGAMGTVYLAHDTVLDRDVALKVMGDFASDADAMERFVREARAVAKLTHPNVVQVFDLGSEQHYIAMELLKGEDLLQALRTGPPLSLARKIDIVLQVLAGLGHAHAAGIVHRDVKPANIFVCQDGTAKIMDFGVARLTTAAATNSGQVVGTADYMSPEQVKAAAVDGRSDLFSVGCVLFELLTRHRPFHCDTLMAIFYMITHEEPDYDLVPTGPDYDSLIPVLKKALAKDVEGRYQTAGEFAADLRACAAAVRGGPEQRVGPDERRRHARMNVDLPVKVEGWDGEGRPWTESAVTEDASLGGGGLRLTRTVAPGAALRLSLSLPRQFRQYDHDEVAYTVWGLVRSVHEGRVGVLFLGREPPVDWKDRPGDTFALPSDRFSGVRQHPRFELMLNLRLTRLQGRAGRNEEWTVTENIGQGGALVRTALRIRTGEEIEIEEVGGEFRAGARVQAVMPGADRVTRLNVQFTDPDAPERVRQVLRRNGIVVGEPAPPVAVASAQRSRVLLVEADGAFARAVRRMLEHAPEATWRVDHVPALPGALVRAEQPGVDAVLLDLAVEEDGLAALDRLHARAPALPIVVITAPDAEDAGIASLRRGAQDYVVRGQFDGALLARFLRTSVERKRAALEVQPAARRAPSAPESRPLEPGLLPAIVREHYVARRTGLLAVVQLDVRRTLRFRDGNLVSASSSEPGERFAATLVRLGLLAEVDIARAGEKALRESRRLGLVLQELELLDEDRLQDALAFHVREVFGRCMGLAGATWSFRDEAVPEHEDVTLRVPTGEILLEAVRRLDDPALVRRVLGDTGRRLRRPHEPLLEFQHIGLSSTEGYVLSRVDGIATGRQVLEVVPLPVEEAERMLLGLLCAGLVEWDAAEPRRGATVRRTPPVGSDPATPPAPAKPAITVQALDRTSPPAARRQQIHDTWQALASQDHFQVLGVERTASPGEVRDAYERLARSFHPDTHLDPALSDLKPRIVQIFVRLGEVFAVLKDPERRQAYERELGARDYQRLAAERASRERRAAATMPPDPVLLVKKAQAFIASGRAAEAVHLLEEAIPLTRGKMQTRTRILLAEAYLGEPRWTNDARALLERVVADDPDHLEPYLMLGRIYRTAGERERAATMYERALQMKPRCPEAVEGLKALAS